MGEAKRRRPHVLAEAAFAGIEEKTFKFARLLCETIQRETTMSAIHKIRYMLEQTNKLIDNGTEVFAKKAQAQCGKGCFYCCAQMVTCSPLEIFVIAAELLFNDKRTDDDIKEVINKLNPFAELPPLNKSRIGKWCPLLKNGECSVYEKRPNVCRTHLSVDREKCRTEDPITGLVPLVGNAKVTGISIRIAMEYVLMRDYGVNIEPVELTHGLLIVLSDFRNKYDAWMAGEDVFALAHEINVEPVSYTELVDMAGEKIKLNDIEKEILRKTSDIEVDPVSVDAGGKNPE